MDYNVVTDIPFELSSSRIADAVVIAIVGEIDMANAADVRQAIDSGHDGAKRVVVDLSSVTFLDSSALNAFVHCQRDLAQQKVEFRIVSPVDQAIRQVFEITHLTEPLSVVDSLDDALS